MFFFHLFLVTPLLLQRDGLMQRRKSFRCHPQLTGDVYFFIFFQMFYTAVSETLLLTLILLIAPFIPAHGARLQIEVVKVTLPREPSLGLQMEEVARGGDGRGLVLITGTAAGGNAEATGKVRAMPRYQGVLLGHAKVRRGCAFDPCSTRCVEGVLLGHAEVCRGGTFSDTLRYVKGVL